MSSSSFARDDDVVVDSKHRTNGELYRALMAGNEKKVIDLCQRLPDHALHILTIQDDTVLQMATYAREADLALKLLDELPEYHIHKLTRQNNVGNTVLHEAATSNHSIRIADKILRKSPGLLGMRNNNGETALFRAARYGKTDIFNFLDAKVSGYDQTSRQFYLQRSDKTNILHITVLSQHFDLARQIADRYEHLIGEKDSEGMTALQLLACNPAAFKWEPEEGFINLVRWCCNPAWRKTVKKSKERCKSAVKLAKFLVRKDTSWEATYIFSDRGKPTIHKYEAADSSDPLYSAEKGVGGREAVKYKKDIRIAGPPLILATKSGIVEIVEEILKVYPQAVEYVDDEGGNILHVAIKYRQLKIFELVAGMGIPMMRLVRKLDNEGNSLLHTVAKKRKGYASEKIEGPAIHLQQELVWFERVKEVVPPHFMSHRNNRKRTAKGFFISENTELRNSAKEWLKSTSEGCSVVAVLIATVAFAAVYTVPGGPNQSTGFPVLANKTFFVVFTVTDVLSLTFALTAVVVFLSILSSPYRFEDFKHSLPNKLMMGFTFLFLSVVMMMMAFGSTIILMIYNKESWAKIVIYSLSFIPVGIFGLSYRPLYASLSKSYKYLLTKAALATSLGTCLLTIPQKVSNLFRCRKAPPTTNNAMHSYSIP